MALARVSLALVLFSTIGCATVRPVMDPAQFVAEKRPAALYVTYNDNSSVSVSQPRISGDSLYGTTPGVEGAEPVAVPLHDLTSIRAPQHDKSKTALLIAAIAAGTAGGVFALTQVFGNSCGSNSFHADNSADAGNLAVSCN